MPVTNEQDKPYPLLHMVAVAVVSIATGGGGAYYLRPTAAAHDKPFTAVEQAAYAQAVAREFRDFDGRLQVVEAELEEHNKLFAECRQYHLAQDAKFEKRADQQAVKLDSINKEITRTTAMVELIYQRVFKQEQIQ